MLKRLCDVETQEDLLSLDATKLEAASKKKLLQKSLLSLRCPVKRLKGVQDTSYVICSSGAEVRPKHFHSFLQLREDDK